MALRLLGPHPAQIVARFLQFGAISVVLITTLFPLYWLVTLSLKPRVEALTTPPVWVPTTLTLSSYWYALFEREVYRYFFNGLVVAGGSSIISLVLGTMAAYGLNAGFLGSEVVALGILTVRMIPPIILAIPLFLIMRVYGVLDTYQGLIFVYVAFTLPFSTWMMRGFLLEVPSELEDAARIDGCSRLGALTRIVLPLIGPGVSATGIFCFLLAWNEFLYALILTRTIATHTMPIAAATFITDQIIEWDKMAATGVIAVIHVILMMAVQKYYVRGLTFGAVRG